MIPVSRDEILPALPGSRQCYKLFINQILLLHVKSFIPARRDSSFEQPGSRFAGTKFSHVIALARLDGIKKLIKKYPQKYISIDQRYFYCVFTTHRTSSVRKKVNKYVCRISSFYRSSHRRCSARKGIFKNFAIFTGKHLCWSLFAGLQVCNFIKKRLQR